MASLQQIRRICKCPVCPHFFLSEKAFAFHMRNEHRCTFPVIRCERLQPKVCLQCAEICKTKKELSRHMKIEHELGVSVREGSFKVHLKRVEVRYLNTMKYAFC